MKLKTFIVRPNGKYQLNELIIKEMNMVLRFMMT